MKNDELFELAKQTFDKCLQTLHEKNHDYSTGGNDRVDALKNFKLVSYLGITDADTGLLVRMCDKMSRMANVYKGGAQVTDEQLQDTVMDTINYCILLLAIKKDMK